MIVNLKITGIVAIYFLFTSITYVCCPYMLVIEHKKAVPKFFGKLT